MRDEITHHKVLPDFSNGDNIGFEIAKIFPNKLWYRRMQRLPTTLLQCDTIIDFTSPSKNILNHVSPSFYLVK